MREEYRGEGSRAGGVSWGDIPCGRQNPVGEEFHGIDLLCFVVLMQKSFQLKVISDCASSDERLLSNF